MNFSVGENVELHTRYRQQSVINNASVVSGLPDVDGYHPHTVDMWRDVVLVPHQYLIVVEAVDVAVGDSWLFVDKAQQQIIGEHCR